MRRAAGWPAGLRWVVRRTRPSRRQARNLTAFERATGWRYSIIVTNIPAAGGIGGVPGSHHAQFTDVLHRQHAVVEDGVRAAKSMGLRNLPSKTWQVNCGWVLAANIAADLVAWCRLLGLYDCDDLKDAEPDTLRYRLLSLPARLVRRARTRVLKISAPGPGRRRSWPAGSGCAPCPHPPDQPPSPCHPERRPPRRSRSRCRPGHTGRHRHPQTNHESDIMAENGHTAISNQPRPTPESSRLVPSLRAGNVTWELLSAYSPDEGVFGIYASGCRRPTPSRSRRVEPKWMRLCWWAMIR